MAVSHFPGIFAVKASELVLGRLTVEKRDGSFAKAFACALYHHQRQYLRPASSKTSIAKIIGPDVNYIYVRIDHFLTYDEQKLLEYQGASIQELVSTESYYGITSDNAQVCCSQHIQMPFRAR